jgi:hypothetical protein
MVTLLPGPWPPPPEFPGPLVDPGLAPAPPATGVGEDCVEGSDGVGVDPTDTGRLGVGTGKLGVGGGSVGNETGRLGVGSGPVGNETGRLGVGTDPGTEGVGSGLSNAVGFCRTLAAPDVELKTRPSPRTIGAAAGRTHSK